MDDEAAILSAIAAHPGEDTPRLAYADWLDDHAAYLPDPDAARVRAEFIRIQCELKKLEGATRAEHEQYIDLYRRQEEIWIQHRRVLLGPLGDELTDIEMTRDVVFDRGFVTELKLDAGQFLRHAEAVAALKPCPRITLTTALGAHLNLILARPELARVRALAVTMPALDLYPVQSGDAAEIAASPYLGGLEVLDLEGCLIGDAGLEALAAGSNLPALVKLYLDSNEISADGVRLLVASPLWPRLKQLGLDRNPLGDDGAIALADAPPTGLRFLNVRGCGIGQAGRQRLLRRRGWNVALF